MAERTEHTTRVASERTQDRTGERAPKQAGEQASEQTAESAADRSAAYRAAGHRALAERWFGRAWAGGDTAIAEEVFAPDFVLNGRTVGPDGPRHSVAAVHRAFSGVRVTLDLVLTDGPHVVTHYTTSARHTGTFRGVPATGRSITATGIVVWEVVDGKVVRDWNVFDTAGLLAQLTGNAALAPAPADGRPAG
ncbi:ester cyclase [Actinacidiphila acididurans]|uniref:Ester cyclase n=1 Tax=Actinacidiphila acididurans TaxID=2784346 RepID=A0ABS2TZF8_9ACTN|nr:ester cyclase [Actinacidiphila acididurans]MBM9508207.1 ester cyclase [Actinacidiphila acididurans]